MCYYIEQMRNNLFFYLNAMIITFFLISCGESFLLSEGDDKENDIQILSLSPGGVIEKGETLSFKVLSSSEEDKPDKLEINLYSIFGDRIGKLENTTFALNEELSLNLFQSLNTGEYNLEFILYIGNTVLSEKEISFFYTEEEFNILGIESFPPVVFPGATVLLSTTISIPEDSDPFLRWTVDEKVITRGLVSEGADKILWSVPVEEGVYSVKVELFPTSPERSDNFPFASEIFMDVELYVSESSTPPSRYLFPEDSYYSLYHFNGNLIDTAKGRYLSPNSDKRMEATPIGEPQLITVDEDFGYYIDSYSGFRINECILPVIKGELKPFTISLGLDLDPAQKNKNILISKTFDNLFTLTIYIGPESYIYATIQSGSKEIIIPSNINTYAIEYRFVMSLSIQPPEKSADPVKNKSLTAIWYLDGIQTNILSFDDITLKITSDGETIIGGEEGFAGVIDELGVYFIDENKRYSINPNMYENAIKQMYGVNYVYAQGFDGIYVPSSIQVEGDDTIKNGKLALESSLSIALPAINTINEDFKIIIDFTPPLPENGFISLYRKNEITPFLEIATSGLLITPMIQTYISGADDGETEKTPTSLKNIAHSFYVKISNRGRIVSFPGEKLGEIAMRSSGKERDEVILKIRNDDKDPIIIDSITVVQD
ncbi:MAG: hypothetical protein JXJ04_06470 [Spirochaetales bacterium]|nr:hypothetical protein [Spirochaetales bacterium]